MTPRPNRWRWTLACAALAAWAGAAWAGSRGQEAPRDATTLPASVVAARPDVPGSHDSARPGAAIDAPAPKTPAAETAAAPQPQSPVAGAAELQSLREFLSAIPKIRIAVPEAPGNGHQAIGATIAKRVRQLGFDGQYELIYPSQVKHKLDVTFQGFDPNGPNAQYLPALGGTAVEEGSLHRIRGERVALAISAADSVLLGEMNAELNLAVGPFKAGTPKIHFAGETAPRQPHLKDSVLQFPVAAPADVGAFVGQQLSGSARMREKVAGMQALAKHLDEIELLPAYGLSDWGHRLTALLHAVAVAQDRAPEKFKAGVVVCMFSHFKDDALDARLSELPREARERLSVAAIRRPDDVERELSQLKPGRILLLRVGGVSQDLFEYIFSRQTLPGTVAGVNAQNMMRVLGLPFLGGDWRGYGEVEQRLGGVMGGRLIQGAKMDAVDESPNDDPQAISDLADFILAAKDPSSALSRAFWDSRPKDPGDDKIAALLALAIAKRRAFQERRAQELAVDAAADRLALERHQAERAKAQAQAPALPIQAPPSKPRWRERFRRLLRRLDVPVAGG